MNPLIHLKQTILPLLFTIMLGCFGLLPQVRAISPAPDGCYPAFTTAEGCNALALLGAGQGNTGIGWYSLFSVGGGNFNTGVGGGALALNTADSNTAVGVAALLLNTTGTQNSAVGADALLFNDVAAGNNAVGAFALMNNDSDRLGFANNNNALGALALQANVDGSENTAVGDAAMNSNTDGDFNTAVGSIALLQNTSGAQNTAIGHRTLVHSTGGFNTALGDNAGENVITASSVTCIGANVAGADLSNTTWIGNVYGVTTQSGTTAPVIVSDSGQLGTVASSERFKKDIASMEKASEAILSLRPITFHYKSDAKNTPQFGLIAEEVAKVNPALVLPDKEGKPFTVRYDQVNAMLLNEFLKEHRKVEQMEKQIAALTAGLQKVRTQLELKKTAPQTVVENR